ncbi:MAG: Gfo/Idh/MocA family oxidoreductase [Chloroflexi bacterium]|nr:Gfo/Idh/MocA family oxidoreductase [Chloroflexota bacterium]
MTLHIGVIGAGMVSQVHVKTCLQHSQVGSISLAESDAMSRQKVSQEFPLRRIESDYRTLLDDPTIDVIDICLPHDLHYPVALEAFAAGKQVITEKPISNTLAEADGMIKAAEQAGRRFYISLNQRFLPVHREVQRILKEGVIGAPVMGNLTIAGTELDRMRRADNWKGTFGRAGGGVLADSGTHVIDLAHYWFGAPQSVVCDLGRHVVEAANKAEDTAALVLTYPRLTLVVALTYAAAGQPWAETRQLWSEDGSIHVRLEDAQPITFWKQRQLQELAVEHNANWWPYSVGLSVSHALDCLAYDRPFAVTPQDARDTLFTIRMAYLAAERGQRVDRAQYAEQTFGRSQ